MDEPVSGRGIPLVAPLDPCLVRFDFCELGGNPLGIRLILGAGKSDLDLVDADRWVEGNASDRDWACSQLALLSWRIDTGLGLDRAVLAPPSRDPEAIDADGVGDLDLF